MTGTRARLKPTQLRELYDALAALKEQEQTALAELHAEDPERLIARFVRSVETVAAYPDLDEPFHDRSPAAEGVPRDISSTPGFVSRMSAGDLYSVAGAPQLSFRLVDRELFPLRSSQAGGPRAPRRTMDVLLADRSGYPIVGELKIGSDKPTYYALIQALMYAAELSSQHQLRRLAEHHGTIVAASGPSLGIYLIGFQVPDGTYRPRSYEASKRIAGELMADRRINSILRSIAYLEADAGPGESLTFEMRFAFDADN